VADSQGLLAGWSNFTENSENSADFASRSAQVSVPHLQHTFRGISNEVAEAKGAYGEALASVRRDGRKGSLKALTVSSPLA
jgi:hypothetical protein